MCCFSGPVDLVSQTQIFARRGEGNAQFLVYELNLVAKESVAMVLPLPVVPGSGEKAVRFINLQGYEEFFSDMRSGFPAANRPQSRKTRSVGGAKAALEVVKVGGFDASYVPTVADFTRLDARFRLPDAVWAKLPGYAKYGFAVFKFQPSRGPIHPMAFSFPTAEPEQVFFPTMHIHDGEVHAKEEFDHTLYYQGPSSGSKSWTESSGVGSQFMNMKKARGLIAENEHVYRRVIRGKQDNGDILLRLWGG